MSLRGRCCSVGHCCGARRGIAGSRLDGGHDLGSSSPASRGLCFPLVIEIKAEWGSRDRRPPAVKESCIRAVCQEASRRCPGWVGETYAVSARDRCSDSARARLVLGGRGCFEASVGTLGVWSSFEQHCPAFPGGLVDDLGQRTVVDVSSQGDASSCLPVEGHSCLWSLCTFRVALFEDALSHQRAFGRDSGTADVVSRVVSLEPAGVTMLWG